MVKGQLRESISQGKGLRSDEFECDGGHLRLRSGPQFMSQVAKPTAISAVEGRAGSSIDIVVTALDLIRGWLGQSPASSIRF
jgi:hypothetical protein